MYNFYTKFSQVLSDQDIPNVPKGGLGSTQISSALQMVFAIFAAVAVLVIAISAFRIVISRGNPQDVSRARDSIIFAIIGLVISMAAFSIVTFVVERV